MLLGFLFLGAYSCCLLQSFYCKTLLSLIKNLICNKKDLSRRFGTIRARHFN